MLEVYPTILDKANQLRVVKITKRIELILQKNPVESSEIYRYYFHMRFLFKDKGANRAEAWIEAWTGSDFEVVCDAYLFLTPDQILVDDIRTYPEFRRQGWATKLIEHLQLRGRKVIPIGIKNTLEAQSFWSSLGMSDDLGKEITTDDYISKNPENFDMSRRCNEKSSKT